MNKVFYHGADFDGHCSAALIGIHLNYKDVEFYPIDYGQEFPFELINKDDTVWMVDYGLQPFKNMVLLNTMCNLIWIDHHITAIEDYEKVWNEGTGQRIKGLRETGKAACELVWEYLWGKDIHKPKVVHLLGRYDVWKHHNVEDCLEFQYGMKQVKNTHPDQIGLWNNLIVEEDSYIIRDMISKGRTILDFNKTRNEKLCTAYAFETEIDGLKAIALNKGISSSLAFESVWDTNKYDLMISFTRSKCQWTVSLYSDKDSINVGQIAKKYKGGGHAGAAGFQCTTLPFDY